MLRQGFVYILTNKYNTTFYIGVTNNLYRRIHEHKSSLIDSFSKKYNLTKLIYFEEFPSIKEAIKREKQLKNWHRNWKINLVKKDNPTYNDLFADAETSSA